MRTAIAFAIAGTLFATVPALAAETDWGKVDQALGKHGTEQPGGVHRVGLPRTDLHVTIDGVTLRPALALGGWLAFKPMGKMTMVMGDIVLTENEINPVMTRLLADGISITAVHNHLLRTHPAIFFMHVAGRGDPAALASAFHDALAAGSKTPFGESSAPPAPPAAAAPADMNLDTAKLEQILGQKGKVNRGVVQFSIPRADMISEDGMAVPPSMGTAIGINFQPTGGGKAAATGDFVLLASEVNPVLQALRRNGIEVTALHNHMLDDQPRTFFVHFWANENAAELAQGLRAALDHVNVAKR